MFLIAGGDECIQLLQKWFAFVKSNLNGCYYKIINRHFQTYPKQLFKAAVWLPRPYCYTACVHLLNYLSYFILSLQSHDNSLLLLNGNTLAHYCRFKASCKRKSQMGKHFKCLSGQNSLQILFFALHPNSREEWFCLLQQ